MLFFQHCFYTKFFANWSHIVKSQNSCVSFKNKIYLQSNKLCSAFTKPFCSGPNWMILSSEKPRQTAWFSTMMLEGPPLVPHPLQDHPRKIKVWLAQMWRKPGEEFCLSSLNIYTRARSLLLILLMLVWCLEEDSEGESLVVVRGGWGVPLWYEVKFQICIISTLAGLGSSVRCRSFSLLIFRCVHGVWGVWEWRKILGKSWQQQHHYHPHQGGKLFNHWIFINKQFELGDRVGESEKIDIWFGLFFYQ